MTKKTPPKPDSEPEVSLEKLVGQALKDAVTHLHLQIKSGDIPATNIQSLVSINRSLNRDDSDPEDVDRRFRSLPADQRAELLRNWNRLAAKRSGLA